MATVYKVTNFISCFLLVIVFTQFSVSSSERKTLGGVDRQDENQLISRLLKHKDANIRQLAARILNSTKDKLNENSESANLELSDKNEIVSEDLGSQQEHQDKEKYVKDAPLADKTNDGYKETGKDDAFRMLDKPQSQSDTQSEGTKSEANGLEEDKEGVNENLQRNISFTKKKTNVKEQEKTGSQEILLENKTNQAALKIASKDSPDTEETNKNEENVNSENLNDNKFDKNDKQSPETEDSHVVKELANKDSSEQNKLHDTTQKKQHANLVENNEEKQDQTPLEQINIASAEELGKVMPNSIENLDPKTVTDKIPQTSITEATGELKQKDKELLENIDDGDDDDGDIKELKNEALAEQREGDKEIPTKDQSDSNSLEQNEEGSEIKENDKVMNIKGDEDDLKETSDKAFREQNIDTGDIEEHTNENSKQNSKEDTAKLGENSRLQQQENHKQNVSTKPTTKPVSAQIVTENLKEEYLNTNIKEQTKEITAAKDNENLSSEHKDKVNGNKTDLKFDSQHKQTETMTKAPSSLVETTSIKQKLYSVLNTKSTNTVLSSLIIESLLTNKGKITVTNSKAVQTSSVQTSTQAVFISRIHDDTRKVVESEQKKEACLPDRDDLYRKSALVSAAIGGAFIGGFLVLAVFYCKMKFSRYYKGTYQRVPVEYDFELNPRLKTHNG